MRSVLLCRKDGVLFEKREAHYQHEKNDRALGSLSRSNICDEMQVVKYVRVSIDEIDSNFAYYSSVIFVVDKNVMDYQ